MNLVNDIFDRVVFDKFDGALYKESHSAIKQIAQVMNKVAPDCDEKTLAFRALHLALMHFGAALTKQDKYNQPTETK